jgi:hypothetical protein
MKKTFKTVIAVLLVTVMLGSSLFCFAEAEEAEKAYAYVNIYDGESIALAMYKVEESDEDGDGAWTVNDVLIAAHNEKCEGGFATENGDYGLFITKLWGVENGGSYGYYKNNASCWSLTDPVEQGDVIYAFAYSDAATYSDAYSFFDTYTAESNGTFTLTLKYVSGYDPETYAPVESPLEGAVITVDGEDTEYVTDEDGKVEIMIEASALISAKKDGLLIVPPVCMAEVKPCAYVNIFDGQSIALAVYKVDESDEDGDGLWTINDVLISLHNEKCEGGFATENGDYGPFITKLWGVENGGAYGYYKNNVMCMGLTDTVEQGDVIYAFAYSDAATYSDAYSFFDAYWAEGESVTLTLKYVSGFDPETYAPIETPLEGAVITVNGEKTDIITDENGSAEIPAPAKTAVISAEKDGLVIIPPVCLFSAGPETGDVNGDGSVDNKDVVALFRYVSSAEAAYDALYDFNGDGEVNNKDVAALFKAVSAKS